MAIIAPPKELRTSGRFILNQACIRRLPDVQESAVAFNTEANKKDVKAMTTAGRSMALRRFALSVLRNW